jgi:uncharacterized protein (DUF1499 family)
MGDPGTRPGISNTLGLLAAVLAVTGPALAWLRLVPGLAGFGLFVLGGLLGLGVAIQTIVRLVRGRTVGGGGLAAVVVAVVLVASALRGRGAPRTNDFTTDLADPPAFHHAQSIPANSGRDMAYPAGFADIQRACCADLRPLELPVPPADALARVLRVAAAMPRWEMTALAGDSIEAVDTSRVFGFHDDVVIRIRPGANGGSQVDMRSKSRDGQGDLGVNAARIRTFLAELARAR